MGAGVCLLPIYFYLIGKSSLKDSSIVLGMFLMITIISLIVRREKTVEVRLFEDRIDIAYPLKNSVFKIPYAEISEVIYSDLSFSLSILLKDGKKISLGSAIQKESGEFTVSELDSGAAQGRPGERLRLKKEIDSRMKIAKTDPR